MSDREQEIREKLLRFLSDPEARIDPYPFYREIREAAPVIQTPDGTWWITNYEGCMHLVRDRRWSHQNPAAAAPDANMGRARQMISGMILFRDPPDHTRLRTQLGRVFMKPVAEEKRDQFRAHIDHVLDEAAARGVVDFREEIARLIPIYMICDVMGLPQARYEDLVRWAASYASMLGVDVTPETERQADADFAEFGEYIAPIAADRRKTPQNDLLSEWVKAADEGGLSADEIPSFALFTFTGGQTTTTMLMTNALYTLLAHRDQWERLVANPNALKESAVEEILRYESAGRAYVPRFAKEDIEVGGKLIRQGEMAIGIESAANRDPAYFPDPETFNIARERNRHIAFGGGLHVCPGQFVARVETQELLAAIAERYPNIAIEGESQWIPEWILRGLDRLPVRLQPRAAAAA